MKEIRFSQHSQNKIAILNRHRILITQQFIIETVTVPDRIEIKEDNKRIAQKSFNENLVIRVVYREFVAFVLIITLYPARKNRYENNDL